MLIAMILIYILQPNLSEPAYKAVMERKLYATVDECKKAGAARAEELQNDQHVKEVVLGVCLPSSDKEV